MKGRPMTDQLRSKRRRQSWFQVENETVDRYQGQCGPYAWAVYTYLLRKLNSETQVAWPKITTIAEGTGMSARSVHNAIDRLEAVGLLTRESGKDRGVHNTYYVHDGLQDVEEAAEGMQEVQRGMQEVQRGMHEMQTGYAGGAEVGMQEVHTIKNKGDKEPVTESKDTLQAMPAEQPKPRKRTPANDIWDALANELGYSPTTGASRGAWNKAIKELLGTGVTPQEVPRLILAYQESMPGMKITPTALAKHVDSLRAEMKQGRRVKPESRHGNGLISGREALARFKNGGAPAGYHGQNGATYDASYTVRGDE